MSVPVLNILWILPNPSESVSCLVMSDLCDTIDCCSSGSSVHRGVDCLWSGLEWIGLEWIAIPFSRRSSRPRDRTQVSCNMGIFFTTEPPRRPLSQQIWGIKVVWTWFKGSTCSKGSRYSTDKIQRPEMPFSIWLWAPLLRCTDQGPGHWDLPQLPRHTFSYIPPPCSRPVVQKQQPLCKCHCAAWLEPRLVNGERLEERRTRRQGLEGHTELVWFHPRGQGIPCHTLHSGAKALCQAWAPGGQRPRLTSL